MNESLISKIENLQNEVQEYNNVYSARMRNSFTFSDIEFDEKELFIQGYAVNSKAKAQLLNTFKIKSQFTSNENRKLLDSQVDNVISKIKSLNIGNRLFCEFDDLRNPKMVERIWLGKHSADSENYPNLNSYFNSIKGNLEASQLSFDADVIKLDEKKGRVNISLLTDRHFNVGDDNGPSIDTWKNGVNFEFDSYQSNIAPYYSRLVCSNGMIKRNEMQFIKLDHSKYNEEKIERLSRGFLVDGKFLDNEMELRDQCKKAQRTDMSIDEFLYCVKAIPEKLAERNDEVSNRFKLDYLIDAYGEFEKNSQRWKQSATIDRKIYDVVNDMTWIASRPDEYNLNGEEEVAIKVAASNILMAKEFCMESLAPNPFSKN